MPDDDDLPPFMEDVHVGTVYHMPSLTVPEFRANSATRFL